MAELAADRAGEIKVKEMSLAEDRFEVAAEEIQNEYVAEQVPWAIVEKHGGDKLPGVGVAHTAITDAEVIANEPGLIGFEKKLHGKDRQVCADQRQENYPLALRPGLRVGRVLSAGQMHRPRVSQRRRIVDSEIGSYVHARKLLHARFL